MHTVMLCSFTQLILNVRISVGFLHKVDIKHREGNPILNHTPLQKCFVNTSAGSCSEPEAAAVSSSVYHRLCIPALLTLCFMDDQEIMGWSGSPLLCFILQGLNLFKRIRKDGKTSLGDGKEAKVSQ